MKAPQGDESVANPSRRLAEQPPYPHVADAFRRQGAAPPSAVARRLRTSESARDRHCPSAQRGAWRSRRPTQTRRPRMAGMLVPGPSRAFRDCPGKELFRPGKRPDEPGKELFRPGKRPDEPGKELFRPGKRLDEPGKELFRPGKRPDEPGKELFRPGKRLDEPGKELFRPGKRPDEPGKELFRPGKRPDEPGTPLFEPGARPDALISSRRAVIPCQPPVIPPSALPVSGPSCPDFLPSGPDFLPLGPDFLPSGPAIVLRAGDTRPGVPFSSKDESGACMAPIISLPARRAMPPWWHSRAHLEIRQQIELPEKGWDGIVESCLAGCGGGRGVRRMIVGIAS